MKIEHLFHHKNLVYSLEIFPPKKTESIQTIYNTLYGLRKLPCDFISVTYGAGGSDTQKNKTFEIAQLIQQEYHIEPVAHLTCGNMKQEDMISLLDCLKRQEIQNILVLRGDQCSEPLSAQGFTYASDLAMFIKAYDPWFHLSGACYPEGHLQAISLEKDIDYLKNKIDQGVTHLVSQMFFDNQLFYDFLDHLTKKQITIPISAGIMPIIKPLQLHKIVSMCGASLPKAVTRMIDRYQDDPLSLQQAGIAYATQQMIDLIAFGVKGIHLYTMNQVDVATTITASIQPILDYVNRA